jgi:hypothetical protein
VPPSAVEVANGRIAFPFVEGILSADGSVFTITTLIDRTRLTAAEDKAFTDERVVEPPSSFVCSAPTLKVIEVGEKLRSQPELTRMPTAVIEDGSGGEDTNYRIKAAFANDQTFQALCDSGIGLRGVTVVDPMHPAE